MKRTVQIEKNSYEVYKNEIASSALVTTAQISRLVNQDFPYVGYGESGLHSNELQPASSEAICFASGVKGTPSLTIRTTNDKLLFLSALIQDAVHISENSGFDTERPFFLEVKAAFSELEFGYDHQNGRATAYDSAEIKSITMFGFCLRPPEHIPRDDEHVRRLSEMLLHHPAGAGLCYFPVAMIIRGGELKLVQPEPESMLQQVEMQLWFPERTCDAADFKQL